MRKIYRIFIIFMILMLSLAVLMPLGCKQQEASKEPSEVIFEQLMSDPNKYNGMEIKIEGYFYQGFETIVLSERLDLSGYAEGHFVPTGSRLWIEGGIPREIYDELHQQQMMGPTERYGRLLIKGKLEYGGEYGHLGQFEFQLIPSLVKLLK